MIIRELQRTNLDVNLAVNNLLSRDDEDGDDGDDTASESYLPGGLSKNKTINGANVIVLDFFLFFFFLGQEISVNYVTVQH